eukprot:jgi/Tetstr1/430314/TSEL_020139.t1
MAPCAAVARLPTRPSTAWQSGRRGGSAPQRLRIRHSRPLHRPRTEGARSACSAVPAAGGALSDSLSLASTCDVASGAATPSLIATVADLTPENAATISAILGPLFAVGTLLMVVRIVTTWYPQIDGSKLPWAAVFLPTEWLLVATRKVVPPQFGVDVSPIVWVAIISFFNEILLGPQGILNLIQKEQLAGF